MARAAKRAGTLIEAMLKEMQRGMRHPHVLESPEWERVFGSKQSAVANLQKLVQALAVLPAFAAHPSNTAGADQPETTLSDEEMQLLAAWLADGPAHQ